MKPLIAVVTSTTFGKWLYGIVFGISTVGIVQEASITNQSFLDTLLNNIPAQVVYVLAIAYGVALVLGKLSDMYKKHKLNLQEIEKGALKVRQEKEHLEQEELTTERQRKEL